MLKNESDNGKTQQQTRMMNATIPRMIQSVFLLPSGGTAEPEDSQICCSSDCQVLEGGGNAEPADGGCSDGNPNELIGSGGGGIALESACQLPACGASGAGDDQSDGAGVSQDAGVDPVSTGASKRGLSHGEDCCGLDGGVVGMAAATSSVKPGMVGVSFGVKGATGVPQFGQKRDPSLKPVPQLLQTRCPEFAGSTVSLPPHQVPSSDRLVVGAYCIRIVIYCCGPARDDG